MLKKISGLVILVVLSVSAYFVIPYFQKPHTSQGNTSQHEVAVVAHIQEEAPEPREMYGMVVDSLEVIQSKIERNQNLSDILSAYNVPHTDIHRLAMASKGVFDVRKIAANKKYTLLCDKDSVMTAKAFVYEPNPIEYVVFKLRDSITVEKVQREVEIVEKGISGVIKSSLSVTMSDLGVSPQLTNDFVDVFGWQIDFFRLQEGDRFKLIYEDKIIDGESIGIGRIKGVYFEHFGNDYYAYLFDQGKGEAHFDEEGQSLRKALLKYPLKFTRISSRYSGNRFHPVQKRWKAHRGTDFAAPKGTPIRAVGDGIISEARYSKYNGNYVKLRHNSTYTTQYLHMSKIASGVKRGIKVKQGQTIGYVGSTGLATGNHLCYRFWKNGVQVDALKVKLPPAEPVQKEQMPAFEIAKKEILQKLDAIHFEPEEKEILVRAN